MTKVENATLKAIAAKFAHMPDEDVTILERQVAKILVDAGYLSLEPLEYEPKCILLEYVLTASAKDKK